MNKLISICTTCLILSGCVSDADKAMYAKWDQDSKNNKAALDAAIAAENAILEEPVSTETLSQEDTKKLNALGILWWQNQGCPRDAIWSEPTAIKCNYKDRIEYRCVGTCTYTNQNGGHFSDNWSCVYDSKMTWIPNRCSFGGCRIYGSSHAYRPVIITQPRGYKSGLYQPRTR